MRNQLLSRVIKLYVLGGYVYSESASVGTVCAECAVFSCINKYVHINKQMHVCFYVCMYLQGHPQCDSDPIADLLVLNHSNMIQTIFLEVK